MCVRDGHLQQNKKLYGAWCLSSFLVAQWGTFATLSNSSTLFVFTISPSRHHAHVKTTTGGPVVSRLLAGGDDASVALPLIVSTALLVEMVSMEKP